MTRAENKKLGTILAKVEALQNATSDEAAKERLGAAKSQLLRLLNEEENKGTA
jgi:hypothetical protein